MWHSKDTQVHYKQINMVCILLCETHPCHLSMNTQIPALARAGDKGIAVLYRSFANLDHVNAFRQLPRKPNNHFERGILNYVPSGWNEFCS